MHSFVTEVLMIVATRFGERGDMLMAGIEKQVRY